MARMMVRNLLMNSLMMKHLIIYIALVFSACFMGTVNCGTALAAEHADAAEYVLTLINNARYATEDALSDINLDKTTAEANLGTDAWVVDESLLPVAYNDTLGATALAHANDMIANLYYSDTSQNGDTVQERITAAGYSLVSAGESLGILSFNKYVEPMEAAKLIFDNMLAYELGTAIDPDDRNIINEERTEVGIAFVSTVADLGLGIPVNLYLVVADFARPVASRYFIVGNVSVKTPDYPDYKLEDALSGVRLRLRELSAKINVDVISSDTGFFQFEMPFGFLLLEAWDDTTGDLLVRKNLFGQNQNIRMNIFID